VTLPWNYDALDRLWHSGQPSINPEWARFFTPADQVVVSFRGLPVCVARRSSSTEKSRLTVISTLGNVMGYSGDDNASGPRHEEQCTIT
jgi:hypothetical protein